MYLDLIKHPENTPKLTEEGMPWAAGYFVRSKSGTKNYSHISVVHVALILQPSPSHGATYGWARPIYGLDQHPTDVEVDFNEFERQTAFWQMEDAEVLCPTKNTQCAITPLYPNFRSIMHNGIFNGGKLPNTKNRICRRCIASYHAIAKPDKSTADIARAERLLRGIGMRQLKRMAL